MDHPEIDVAILENVLTLKTQIQDVADQLADVGFNLVVWEMSPVCFGVGYQRDRVWLLAIRDSTVSREKLFADAPNLMQSFVHTSYVPLEHWLLPDSHEAVQSHFQQMASGKDCRANDKSNSFEAMPRLGRPSQ
jgi:hypothetical protein